MLTEGLTEREAATVSEHFAYLQGLVEAGTVLMAGRTLTNDERTFGIVVFVAPSESEAAQVVANDPVVKHGVMHAESFPYRIALWSAHGPPSESDA
jgi:uncharacterized protein YciI